MFSFYLLSVNISDIVWNIPNTLKKLFLQWRRWKRLPTEMVDAPFLETFRVRLDGGLSNLIWLKMSLFVGVGGEWTLSKWPLKDASNMNYYMSLWYHILIIYLVLNKSIVLYSVKCSYILFKEGSSSNRHEGILQKLSLSYISLHHIRIKPFGVTAGGRCFLKTLCRGL